MASRVFPRNLNFHSASRASPPPRTPCKHYLTSSYYLVVFPFSLLFLILLSLPLEFHASSLPQITSISFLLHSLARHSFLYLSLNLILAFNYFSLKILHLHLLLYFFPSSLSILHLLISFPFILYFSFLYLLSLVANPSIDPSEH